MKKSFLAGLLILATTSAFSQNLQSPAEFLGYELGDRFTRHHRIVEYFNHVASVQSNVVLQQYGETNEHRPLVVAILSSQKNMDRLEEIRLNNLKRTGIEEGSAADEAISIVWLSYNVHGNEASSSEATMETLWALANSENKSTQEWLENTVVIMDPCINPDGRDRYANFYNQFGDKTPNPSLAAREHYEPWPGGRFNHYMYDLNRDWAWQTQLESRSRIKLYNHWMPHIHVDFHEQGANSPYYFAPAAEPYHKAITNWQRELQDMIGKNHAKYFDDEGWAYFTKERFDLLYPSYGDTYPTYNGAIGMTYEQAGGGAGGLAVDLDNGDTLKLSDRVAHHTTTGLSTVEVASQNSQKIVSEFQRFFEEVESNKAINYKSFVVSQTNNADKLASLTTLLERNGIEYGYATAGGRKLTGYNYQANRQGNINVTAGDLVVSVNQPRGTMVSILFEPVTELSDSMTYDITAWSLPYAYGLEAYASTTLLSSSSTKPATQPAPSGKVDKPVALITQYESFADVKFLAAILKEGIQVRSATEAFTVEGKPFKRGSLLVMRSDNKHVDGYVQTVRNLAEKHGRNLYESSTGFVDRGKDFGSSAMGLIKPPSVALLAGEGASPTGFGPYWYYFEQEIDYPVTVIDTDYFSRVDMAEFDVLIVPTGRYDIFNEEMLKDLSAWIRDGGRLILVGGALRSVVDSDMFALKSKLESDPKPEKEEPEQQKFEDRRREYQSSNIPGAIYNVKLDNSHPLAFGYDSRIQILKRSSSRYVLMNDGWNVGVLESPEPVAGFAGYKTKERLQNTLVFGVENQGAGAVVYFVDDPIFRSFWENGKQLLGNAIFVVGL